MKLRYFAFWILGMVVAPAYAATYTQSLALEPGWNSVWLYVEPVNVSGEVQLVDAVFDDADISIVARHVDATNSIEYVSSLSEETFSQEYWQVWWRDTPLANSNLATIDGGVAYLVHNAGNSVINLDITGEVHLRKPSWTPDSYNYVGFSLSNSVTFGDAFNAVASTHPFNKIFKLQSDGVWLAVSETENMQDGEAYWIYCDGNSTFNGPLSFTDTFYQGIDFGTSDALIEVDDPDGGVNPINVSRQQLTVANIGDSSVDVTVHKVSPELGSSTSDELRVYDLTADTDSLAYSLGNQWGNANVLTTIDAGKTTAFFVGAHRNWDSGTREQENLYYLEANGFRYWLEISAENQDLTDGSEASADPSYAGLWLGEVFLNEVTDLTTPGRPLSSTTSNAGMRMILHADATGNVSLVSSVTAMQREATEEGEAPEPVLVIDESKLDLFAGIEERGGKQVGIRIDSVAYDMPRKFDAETQPDLFEEVDGNINGGLGAEQAISILTKDDAGFASLDGAYEIEVLYDRYVFVLSSESDALALIDMQDPAAPVLLDVVDSSDGFNYLQSSGTELQLHSSIQGIVYVVNPTQSAITVLDVDFAGGEIRTGFEVVDNMFQFDKLEGVSSVYLDVNFGYAISSVENSLTVFSATPGIPQFRGTIADGDTGVSNFDDLRAITGSGNYLYVSSAGSNNISILDKSNAVAPEIKVQLVDGQGGYDYLNLVTEFLIDETVLYALSEGDNAITAIDISDPESPVLLGTYRNTGVMNGLKSMALYNDSLYVSESLFDSIVILDVSDPTSIVFEERYRDGDDFDFFAGVDGIAFSNGVGIAVAAVDDAMTVFNPDFEPVDEAIYINYLNAQPSRPINLVEDYHLTWPLTGGLGPDSILSTPTNAPLNLDAFHRSNPFRHLFHQKHAAGYGVERAITITLDGDHEAGVLTGSYQEVMSGLAAADIITQGSIRLVKVSDVDTLQ